MRRYRAEFRDRNLCIGVDLPIEAGTCGRLVSHAYERCRTCYERRRWLLNHALNPAEVSLSALLESIETTDGADDAAPPEDSHRSIPLLDNLAALGDPLPALVAHGVPKAGAHADQSSSPSKRRATNGAPRKRRSHWLSSLWEDCSMFDTHAVARSLTAADFTPAQADALTDAIRSAAEQGDHVTSDQFKAGQAELRAEIANLDTRLSTQIADVRTQMSRIEADLKSDMKLLKFGYGPVVLGLLIKLVFFP